MKILIAIPTFENILPDTFKSVYDLAIPDGAVCSFEFIRGYDCAKARNEIAKRAKEYDYVLMVDSDIILPNNALVSMLSANVDVCLGVYPRKNTSTGQTEIFKLGYENFTDESNMSIDEVLEHKGAKVAIKGGGLGCALIKSTVFNFVKFPWFKYVQYDTGDVLSEDNYFCCLVRNAGLNIVVDTHVLCGHSIRGFQWR